MPIRFFYFDLGNVILHFDHQIAIEKIAAVTDVDAELVRKIVFDDGLEEAYERGDIDSNGYFQTFCEKTGKQPAMEDLLFASSDIFQLNTPIVPVIAQLSNSNHKIGVLSNTCQAHWDYCVNRYLVLTTMFDVHALSFELGAMKPDPTIYTKATELAGVNADEIFFVDDRAENVAAAKEAGYRAIEYRSPDTLAEELRRIGVKLNF